MRFRRRSEPETPTAPSYLETLARQARHARENRRHLTPPAEPTPDR
ncbi:hypothetical protein SAMN05421505_104154 [Sinosporangium album]|uniref:Uncharacterized protein n=1 Tax=Sinosporangium album TaxID=504805 RepID=A0A1G7U961_9ACTN|nr:hypothetical protein [Sinosporangium album]SDG43928.1 hypothetical protein SAMN05421505_104154 [Sinosporangium album]